jgi:hypothetical protein
MPFGEVRHRPSAVFSPLYAGGLFLKLDLQRPLQTMSAARCSRLGAEWQQSLMPGLGRKG